MNFFFSLKQTYSNIFFKSIIKYYYFTSYTKLQSENYTLFYGFRFVKSIVLILLLRWSWNASKKIEEIYTQLHMFICQINNFTFWYFHIYFIYFERVRVKLNFNIDCCLFKRSRCVVPYWKLVSEHTFTSFIGGMIVYRWLTLILQSIRMASTAAVTTTK